MKIVPIERNQQHQVPGRTDRMNDRSRAVPDRMDGMAAIEWNIVVIE
jgi:hypothetical protein